MYINKINDFLEEYGNIDKQFFLEIISKSNNKGFVSILFEKDFLLTLILIKFGEKYPDLIFKGGTCLNKIYFPYFRLSEDLDFIINHTKGATARKTLLRKYEKFFIEDLEKLGIKLQGKHKVDKYKLAMFTFEYKSIIDNSIQTIKIDISLKNNLKLQSNSLEIKSVFLDPVLEDNIFKTHHINCIDLKESVAEKLRASLTRPIPAIRDFFDIWYIKNTSEFNFECPEFNKLLQIKLQEVNYDYSLEIKKDSIIKQIETDLKPVLNENFEFNFEEIYDFILTFKQKQQ